MARELLLGVFHHAPDMRHSNYFFVVGSRKQIESYDSSGGSAEKVKLMQPPVRFRNPLKELLRPRQAGPVELGYISYQLDPSAYENKGLVAVSAELYPKNALEVRKVSTRGLGLGYYLEALSAAHLHKNGVDFFRTSIIASDERRGQVRKVGLEPATLYDAKTWLAALGRGVRQTTRVKG